MTQEENYKQKYKDALERASKLRVQNPFDTVGQMVEYIFPELKESEDERIRKAIKKALQVRCDGSRIISDEPVTLEEAIAWLEKQGKEGYALKSFGDEDVHKFMQYIEKQAKVYEFNLPNRGYDIYAFAKDILIWLEKQDEKKPADKVEPKFHEGEWITNGDYTWKIVEITPLDYILQSQDGNIVDDTISYVDEHFHRWTIADAKDGDVLTNGESIVIFKQIVEPKYRQHIEAHIGLDWGCNIQVTSEPWLLGIDKTMPATKEQRDLLFQKMKEAGYEWDAEKKELKKIKIKSENLESKPLDADKVIEWLKNTIKERAEKFGVYKATRLILPYNSIEDLINDFKEDFGL